MECAALLSFGTVKNGGIRWAVLRRSQAETVVLRRHNDCSKIEFPRTPEVAPLFLAVPKDRVVSRWREISRTRRPAENLTQMRRGNYEFIYKSRLIGLYERASACLVMTGEKAHFERTTTNAREYDAQPHSTRNSIFHLILVRKGLCRFHSQSLLTLRYVFRP